MAANETRQGISKQRALRLVEEGIATLQQLRDELTEECTPIVCGELSARANHAVRRYLHCDTKQELARIPLTAFLMTRSCGVVTARELWRYAHDGDMPPKAESADWAEGQEWMRRQRNGRQHSHAT